MKNLFLILFLSLAGTAVAQKNTNAYAAVDKAALAMPADKTNSTTAIAAYINSNFQTQTDKVRAIFIWVATNVSYDVDNMFAFNEKETTREKIDKVLRTRKGVCEHYAALFNELCEKCEIPSSVVVGYTRQNNQTGYTRHGWCAARIDGKWRLFDPTWGSGVILNDKFSATINNQYFMADPTALLKTHMPFDPMWQMLESPLTNKEFADGKLVQGKTAQYFSYADTIEAYLKLNDEGKMVAEARRLELNGVSNQVVHDRLYNLRENIEILRHNATVERQNKLVDVYNSAVSDFNEGVNDLNEFINYRNHQFTPARSDVAIRAMLDKADTRISGADTRLKQIKGGDPKIDEMIKPVLKTVNDAMSALAEQKAWLNEYMGKSKLGRKTMFRKYTWMGMPLN